MPNARCYIELFDGAVAADGYVGGHRVTDLTIKVEVGGYEAYSQPSAYTLKVTGRSRLNGADLVTLHEEPISLDADPSSPEDFWRSVTIDLDHVDADAVHCIVAKMTGGHGYLANTPFRRYQDQVDESDPPPWGFKIKSYQLYASDLRRNVTPERVVEDLVSMYPQWRGEHFFCPDDSGVTIDQLVFEDIPKDRLQALQELDELLDWDYEATRDSFTYRKPVTLGEARDDELYRVSLSDPHHTGSITPDMSDCFKGVRAIYTGKGEKPKEVIVWGESETLGSAVKARVYELPSSIRSKKQATRVATRLLAGHLEPPIAGSPRFVGTVPVASGEDRDCLLVRPGELLQVTDAPRTYSRTEREISSVTLRPLSHEAEVELGAKSRKFEKWLAQLAAKGKA